MYQVDLDKVNKEIQLFFVELNINKINKLHMEDTQIVLSC